MFCIHCGNESEKKWHPECHANNKNEMNRQPYCQYCGTPKQKKNNGCWKDKCLNCFSENDQKKLEDAVRLLLAKHPQKIRIIYECSCSVDGKVDHHFNYRFPFDVIRLCNKCHQIEHARLRRLAASAAANTSRFSSGPFDSVRD